MSLENLSGLQLDEYTLRDLLGQGGMSAVYRAYQEELERYVAVKVLSSKLAQEAGYMQRFSGEAKMAAGLEHPHIVPVYDYGTKDGMSYVVMRLLSGGTLKDRLKNGEPLRLRDVNDLLDALARALDYAHSRGIVHRDIKPANIMFDDQRTVYLVDFGIAKAVNADVQLTADNIVLGTPAYMAPEQWRADLLTPALDQYALAVVVYAMLTGKLPFDGDTSHTLMFQHMNETPPPPHEVNPALPHAVSEVVMKALSKKAEDRYPRVTNFANAFKQATQTPNPPALTDSPAGDYTVPSKSVDAPPPPAKSTLQARAVRPQEYQPPAQDTMPNQRYQAPPSRPSANQSANQPLPRTQLPDDNAPGSRTLFNQFATGGIVGLVMLFIVVVIICGLIVVFVLSRGGDDNGGSSDNGDNSAEVIDAGGDTFVDNSAPTTIAIAPTVAVNSISNVLGERTLYNDIQVPVRDAAWSITGMIASAHGDNIVRVWRDANGGTPTLLVGHSNIAETVDFSPDGRLLASGSTDQTIRVWSMETMQTVRVLNGHTGTIRDVVFSPNGLLLASASEDGTVRVWDVETGSVINTINADSTRVLGVDFSPDGATLVSGGRDGTVKLWDVFSGTRRGQFSGHTEEIRSVAFSPDGTLIASGSTDNSVRVWEVASGNGRFIQPGHGRDVWRVVWHPSGTAIASGGRGNTLRLWDANTGEQITLLSDFVGWVLGIGFSADGTQMVSGAGDGTVRVWRVD